MIELKNMELTQKIKERKATVSVIGLGYVGLPLCLEFVQAGFNVVGLDINKSKVKSLQRGESYVTDITNNQLLEALKTARFDVTDDFSVLEKIDTVSICVPTPLRKTKEPDISFIVSATEKVARHLKKGQLIILESTTYPGTTEEIVLPELEKRGLKVGKDFFLAFSPERIDPGNERFSLKNTPKIIGGTTPNCTEMAMSLYSSIVERVIPVSSTQAAEMVKLLENTFRAVNIGLVNEIAMMADRLNLDVWEIIDAAATKPFGFLPFYPGPGLGGHCIPVDPHYLSWKLKALNYTPRFIELAQEINSRMPGVVVDKVAFALNKFKKSINGSKVLILGVAYKKDVGDVRESPALDIIELLRKKGAEIYYEDQYCPEIAHDGHHYASLPLDQIHFNHYDCAIVVTNHSYYDWEKIVASSQVVLDCRNATGLLKRYKEKIIKI